MGTALWSTLLALAPWLLLGLAIAGLLHGLVPAGFIRRQLRGVPGVAKAVAVGVPLPLCSCGVIPAALGLKRDGASHGAVVAFLISTPQTGVDSILVSASFLGWPFALLKVASAVVTGLLGGLWVEAADRTPSTPAPAAAPASRYRPGRARDMVLHAVQILRSIWRVLVLGILVSAAIETLLPPHLLADLAGGGTLLPTLVALLVSIPLYVCATASVPIAAALVGAGMPPSAALVFLMAGPATNVATIGAVYRTLGPKTLAIYLGSITVGSVACGLTFESLLQMAGTTSVHVHGGHGPWVVGSALVLLALFAWFAIEDAAGLLGRLRAFRRRSEPAIEIALGGLRCSGCVSTLERALRDERGVTSVVVSLEPARAVVRGSVDVERLRRVIEDAGYNVTAPPRLAPAAERRVHAAPGVRYDDRGREPEGSPR